MIAIGGGGGCALATVGAASHLWGDAAFLAGFAFACLLTALGVYVLIAEFIGGIGRIKFPLPPTRHEREAKRRVGLSSSSWKRDVMRQLQADASRAKSEPPEDQARRDDK